MSDTTVKSPKIPAPIWRGIIIGLASIAALSGLAAVISPGRLPAVAFLLGAAYVVGLLSKRQEKQGDPMRTGAHATAAAMRPEAEAELKRNLDNAARSKMQSLVKRNHELLVLYSLANVVGSSLELSEVLSVGLDGVVKIFGARAGEIAVIGAPEETLVVFCRGAAVCASHRGPSAPRLNRGLAADVAKTGEAVITHAGLEAGHFRGVSQLAVFPIKTKSRIVGTISLALADRLIVDKLDKELLVSIGSMIGTAIENSQLYQRLKRISDTDPITGLYNHRFILKRLNAELRRAARYEHAVSVLMLDVDSFKELNDNFGHPFGDTALKKIALATMAACRETDFVGRYGGDEFLVVLPETRAEAAANVSDRIRRHIQNLSLSPGERQAKQVNLTASLGLAVYPNSGKTGTELIMAADKNLYLSKRAGGNQLSGRQAV